MLKTQLTAISSYWGATHFVAVSHDGFLSHHNKVVWKKKVWKEKKININVKTKTIKTSQSYKWETKNFNKEIKMG